LLASPYVCSCCQAIIFSKVITEMIFSSIIRLLQFTSDYHLKVCDLPQTSRIFAPSTILVHHTHATTSVMNKHIDSRNPVVVNDVNQNLMPHLNSSNYPLMNFNRFTPSLKLSLITSIKWKDNSRP